MRCEWSSEKATKFPALPVELRSYATFGAVLAGSGVDDSNDLTVWLEDSGSFRLVAREGDAAPGLPSGVNFTAVSAQALNSAGQIALNVVLTGDAGVGMSNVATYVEDSGSFRMVARSGDPAPGTDVGVEFDSVDTIGLDSAGRMAIAGTVKGDDVDFMNDHGIWSEAGGTLELVAREGDPAPGTASGVTFETLRRQAVNSTGQLAFKANLTGVGVDNTNSVGIWSEGFGALSLLARIGDQAPGMPSGVTFEGDFQLAGLNAAGQTIFQGFAGAGVDSTDRSGIWATDRAGVLQLIIHAGDELKVAPGEFRTVVVASMKGADTDEELPLDGFNDRGQIVFFAILADGTQDIFVSNRVAVPEPASVLLAAAALLALFAKPIFRSSLRANRAEWLTAGTRRRQGEVTATEDASRRVGLDAGVSKNNLAWTPAFQYPLV